MLKLPLSSNGPAESTWQEEGHLIFGLSDRGLALASHRPLPTTPETVLTAEAGINLGLRSDFRADPLVNIGDQVLQGAPVLRDRRRPECVVTAPMTARIAEQDIGARRRLQSLVFHAEDGNDERHLYDVHAANAEIEAGKESAALRSLLQQAGLWMRLRSRPFGVVPAPAASPAAIFVMAVDTRPQAPDPRLALGHGHAAHLALGLRALGQLLEGWIHFCQDRGDDIVAASDRIRIEKVGSLHPSGSAGFCIHRSFPARLTRHVWSIEAEDVVAIGHLLAEGSLPATRLISLAGPGMREARLVRCQPGADLRALCHAHMRPGENTILSGALLDGEVARWLNLWDRQASVIVRKDARPQRNWLEAALRRASGPEPVIPTAALEQALGGYAPGMALLRALSVGDDEAVADLGGLSLLEEDLALADYVTSANPRFADLLRASLDRIEANP